MNILYISYWGIQDPLTVSTVYPHLEILNSYSNIDSIILVTVEHTNEKTAWANLSLQKVTHIALKANRFPFKMVNKITGFLYFPQQITRITRRFNIEKIIARTALAGALAFKVSRKTGISFYVESFEPHSDYMAESGVWNKHSVRYIFQKKWEKKQLRYATAIMPVSNNYRNKLIAEGIPESKLFTIPCCVYTDTFTFSEDNRKKIREKLGHPLSAIVGIYVGKFGGMYYEDEAFYVFKKAFEYFKDEFRLLIITPSDKTEVSKNIAKAGLDGTFIFVDCLKHEDIPAYLSASDFAFAFYKPNFSARFLSPVKDGEYWANGLPVLCPANIGDDSEIIEKENAGAIFKTETESLHSAFKKITLLLQNTENRNRIRTIAEKYRNFSIAKIVYQKLYGNTN